MVFLVSSKTTKPIYEPQTSDQKVPEPGTTKIIKETNVTSVTTIKHYTAPNEVPDQTETEPVIDDRPQQLTADQEQALEKLLETVQGK